MSSKPRIPWQFLHPWPPNTYTGEALWKFYDRENERLRNGALTQAAWERFSYARRRKVESPEARYWRRWRDNQSRVAARRAHRERRRDERAQSSKEEIASAQAFYRELRKMPSVACAYCGRSVPGVKAHADHVVPLCRGGAHRRENLVAACPTCNHRKNRLTGDEYRTKLAGGANEPFAYTISTQSNARAPSMGTRAMEVVAP